jgi:hypothetical protein
VGNCPIIEFILKMIAGIFKRWATKFKAANSAANAKTPNNMAIFAKIRLFLSPKRDGQNMIYLRHIYFIPPAALPTFLTTRA